MDQAQAMFFLANAWLKVKPETIKNCWQHTKILAFKEKTICDFEPVEYPTSALPLEEEIVAELNGMLPDLPGNFNNEVTDVSQLNLEADENDMIVCYITSTTNNEETTEGNVDETEENDNTEQDEQCVGIVECKKRLREAYETILMYEVPLDDLDRKLHRRIRMRLAGFCAELNKSKEKEEAEKEEAEGEEKKQKERRYVLDLQEVNSTDLASLTQHKTKKKGLTFEERLLLSSIKIVSSDPLPGYHLPDSSYSLIRRWRKALEDEVDFFVPSPAPTNLEEMSIAHTLSALFLHDVRSKRFKHKNLEYKYYPSKIDYIVKYGSILLQNTFSDISDISVDWDTTSAALKESVPDIFKSIRPDLIVICAKGVEVGCGELKPFGKAKELIEIDRPRIGEVCKRQLHVRMWKSKSMKEHVTLGILLAGYQLELIKLKFNNGEYEYSLLKTIKLFGRDTYYKDIENALANKYASAHSEATAKSFFDVGW
ncbi:hypothetical protein G6F43_001539 [Rhizopus delemar]|nr:hypothetical protein G6F43_001539 [Rhizopus delemar]